MKGLMVRDGKVYRILDPVFLENNTDWLTNGVPEGCFTVEDDVNVEVNDYIDSEGNIDTLGRLKEPKYQEITDARYRNEISGTTVNGVTVATDRESQALITGAALKATTDPNYVCTWKSMNGFVELTSEMIMGIADAVRTHVQGCFNQERELIERVKNATTVEEVRDIQWEKVD